MKKRKGSIRNSPKNVIHKIATPEGTIEIERMSGGKVRIDAPCMYPIKTEKRLTKPTG